MRRHTLPLHDTSDRSFWDRKDCHLIDQTGLVHLRPYRSNAITAYEMHTDTKMVLLQIRSVWERDNYLPYFNHFLLVADRYSSRRLTHRHRARRCNNRESYIGLFGFWYVSR